MAHRLHQESNCMSACMNVLIVAFVVLLSSDAFTKAGPEWAQLNMSPSQKKWFQEQKEPGTQKPCCNSSDGEDFIPNAAQPNDSSTAVPAPIAS
jgi:hypothetical protein